MGHVVGVSAMHQHGEGDEQKKNNGPETGGFHAVSSLRGAPEPHQAVDEVEAGERDDEHDPAGELVEEAERLDRIPVLDTEAGPDDADDVGRDRDGNAGQGQDDAAQGGALKKVSVKDRQVKRLIRERMPLQASATSSFMTGSWITLPSCRTGTPSIGSIMLASLEASSCRGKVIWLKMIAGKGMASRRIRMGKRSWRSMAMAEEGPDQPCEQDHEGDARGKEIDPVDAEDQDDQPQDHNGKSGPTWANRSFGDLLPPVPKQEEREERHQKAVGVVGDVVPVDDQLDPDAIVERDQQDGDDEGRQPGSWRGLLAIAWPIVYRIRSDDFSRRVGRGSRGESRSVCKLPVTVPRALYFTNHL